MFRHYYRLLQQTDIQKPPVHPLRGVVFCAGVLAVLVAISVVTSIVTQCNEYIRHSTGYNLGSVLMEKGSCVTQCIIYPTHIPTKE